MNWTVEKLNTLLAQELGRNIYGQGIFAWKWSDSLFWPSTFTGRMVNKEISVPIIGTDETEKTTVLVKEFKPSRMTHKYKKCWIVCRWLSPAALVGLKLDLKIGPDPDIPRSVVLARWQSLFPGADYPERGWYMHTDYANKPDVKPTFEDTQFLIQQLRHQLSDMSMQTRYLDMCAADDAERARIRRTTEDICADAFTAFLNPYPGKRGGFVSFGGVDKKDSITKENVTHG